MQCHRIELRLEEWTSRRFSESFTLHRHFATYRVDIQLLCAGYCARIIFQIRVTDELNFNDSFLNEQHFEMNQ